MYFLIGDNNDNSWFGSDNGKHGISVPGNGRSEKWPFIQSHAAINTRDAVDGESIIVGGHSITHNNYPPVSENGRPGTDRVTVVGGTNNKFIYHQRENKNGKRGKSIPGNGRSRMCPCDEMNVDSHNVYIVGRDGNTRQKYPQSENGKRKKSIPGNGRSRMCPCDTMTVDNHDVFIGGGSTYHNYPQESENGKRGKSTGRSKNTTLKKINGRTVVKTCKLNFVGGENMHYVRPKSCKNTGGLTIVGGKNNIYPKWG